MPAVRPARGVSGGGTLAARGCRLRYTLETDEIANGGHQGRTIHRIKVKVSQTPAGKIDDLFGGDMRRLLEALHRSLIQMNEPGDDRIRYAGAAKTGKLAR